MTTIAPTTFEYHEDGGIATITLNRPDRLNALTFEVYAELRGTFAALADRDSVRVVVITGAGRGFCSGGDVEAIIGELLDRDLDRLREFTKMTCDVVRNIRALPKPVIAAVNGVAAGAGAVIALACDFRVGGEDSSFAFLFTKVGLAGADMGAAYLLPRTVGLARATELLFLGNRVAGEAACRMGLLTCIVPGDELLDEAHSLAVKLAAGPSSALAKTKELLHRELDMEFGAALDLEGEAQALCMESPNFKEAYTAFVEKRKPNFE
ncbi:MAG: enoyl-CoA hydratase family protein [Vicinamibacterales bacterium]|jgi:enoyl-CoA hydratase/carnithine racemase|nr:enoyl-CoA hydratase [Acidobacteriota bacterium]MDP6371696.1 enoyl-CoA hydratase family protein [Vicinamibacterales bacterium]MDP6608678.1 enoyl-CoA hydratase family protein [Vicinamibacterales bacterium]HAK56507.1 enoyl-CoA hydratase family protein [Acidobacteriota bacterium]|tara:strand:- start:4058 stop:4855 length:798 start_codon:yes stop_codon:yes gene_type:complete